MKSTGLQDSNPDQMPASQKPLGTDKESTKFTEQRSYSSVVGMLLYLAVKSQPEIAYNIHQCAQSPTIQKASHGNAVKRIVDT